MESLPIANPGSMISLHFTDPQAEVVPQGRIGEIHDISTLEDEHLSYDVSMKVAHTSRISISYDIQKLDEMQAGKFM